MAKIDTGFNTNSDDVGFRLTSGSSGLSLLEKNISSMNKEIMTDENQETRGFTSEYIYNQSSGSDDSEFIIGPVRFTYSVQSIDIHEQKAVGSVDSTRSDRQLLIDTGTAKNTCVVQFVFPTLEDINTGLRAIIALFKTCPIVTVKNELITKTWLPDFTDRKLRLQQAMEFKQKVSDILDFFTMKNGNLNTSTSRVDETSSRPSAQPFNSETQKSFSSWLKRINESRAATIKNTITSLESVWNYGVDNILPNVVNKGISAIRSAILPSIVNLNDRKNTSEFAPVALESLSVQTIPDIPNALAATLSFSLIDVSSITYTGELEYLGKEPNSHTIIPTQAFWLKKWLTVCLDPDKDIVPLVTESDMDSFKLQWFGITDTGGIAADKPIVNVLEIGKDTKSRVAGLSCSMNNHFSFHRMIGKSIPCAQHIGSSGRSVGVEFDTLDEEGGGDNVLEKLHLIKHKSDQIVRKQSRIIRIMGWEVVSPVTKLLGTTFRPSSGKIVTAASTAGVYVAITCKTQTTGSPYRRKVSMEMLENNVNLFRESEVVLYKGGTDFNEFRDWFIGKEGDDLSGIVPAELAFRRLPLAKRLDETRNQLFSQEQSAAKNIIAFDAYKVFWPTSGDFTSTAGPDTLFAALNRDTLIATILNQSFDKDLRLQRELENTTLATGQAENGNRESLYFYALIEGFIRNGISLPGIDDPRIGKIPSVLRDNIFPRMFKNYKPTREEEDRWLGLIIGGMFGRPSYASTLIAEWANPKDGREPIEFSRAFIDALFDVIVERRRASRNTPNVFSTDGLHRAFFALYSEFILNGESYPSLREARKQRSTIRSTEQQKVFRKSTYPDIPCPTYQELFGDDWIRFAPTFDDVGQVNWNVSQVAGIGPLSNFNNAQLLPSVGPDDPVPPSIWFYSRRTKSLLREEVEKSAKGMLPMARTLYIPLSFGKKDYDTITKITPGVAEELVSARETKVTSSGNVIAKDNRFVIDRSNLSKEAIEALNTLEGIITQGIRNKLNSPSASEVDYYGLNQLQRAARTVTDNPQFLETFFGPNAKQPLSLYFSNANQVNAIYQMSADVRGAALLRVIAAEIFKLREDIGYGHPILEEASATAGKERDDIFRRNLESETKRTIQSMVDQMPDQIYSPSRLWPTVKLYLIEQRGNDVIADDAFFDVSTIVSIDITDDKDDAPLAVIKIADPLYKLQEDTFPLNNKVTLSVNDSLGTDPNYQPGASPKSKSIVLGSSSERDLDILLKRYKLAQGRGIQIRMGYDSIAENLHIVFTGRITEIEPGDVVTVIAQGWKAELINRQVNFHSNKGKNLSVKDIVVQTIQLSSPEGIGQHFNRRDSNYLIDQLEKLPNQAIVRHALQVGRDTSSPMGIRTIGQNILYPIASLYDEAFNTNYSAAPDDVGLDTRLKNVWVPDISHSAANPTLFQRYTSTTPSFQTGYWIVPLQPAWDVLKEASRHAWNCIVQVVPFDGEATLFFGHPDQPYYFTRGDNYANARWYRYASELSNKGRESLDTELINKFIASKFYKNPLNNSSREGIIKADIGNLYISQGDYLVDTMTYTVQSYIDAVLHGKIFQEVLDAAPPTFKTILPEYYTIAHIYNRKLNTLQNNDAIQISIIDSPLPKVKLDELTKVFGNSIYEIIVAGFFGLDVSTLIDRWPSFPSDLATTIESKTKGTGDNATTTFYDRIVTDSTPLSDIGGKLDLSRVKYTALVSLCDLIINYISIPKGKGLTTEKGITEWLIKERAFLSQFSEYTTYVSEGLPSHPSLHKILTGTIQNSAIDLLQARFYVKNGLSRKEYLSSGVFRTLKESEILGRTELFLRDLKRAYSRENSTRAIAEKFNRTNLGTAFPDLSSVNTIGEMLDKFRGLLKAFVYFLGEYVASDSEVKEKVSSIGTELALSARSPIMKTFRQYHYLDDEHDIITNNIVVSTSQMWNTVVINKPSADPADLRYASDTDFYRGARISPTVSWEYWPNSEISQVIGLQFHPGLGLSNKKVKICTELNAGSEPVAAKLACVNLAEGIRRMYRGHLIIKGRHIKPHDRILIQDNYTGMYGPLEVESVTHHWSADSGWISNILPQAVCDANPGAAALQTAIMESALRKAYNVVDFLFYASAIIGAAGVVSAAGKSMFMFAKKGLTQATERLIARAATNAVATQTAGQIAKVKTFDAFVEFAGHSVKAAWTRIRREGLKGSLQSAVVAAVDSAGGRFGVELLRNYGAMLSTESLLHAISVGAFTSAWMNVGEGAKQLPVILSPLYLNGAVWTAGLEADEILFAVPFFDTYYSLKSQQEGIIAFLAAEQNIYSSFGDLPR